MFPCRGVSVTLVERLQATGIRRLGDKKRGFRYASAERKTPSASDLARIRALKIPPAWKDVAINASPRGSVQAVGRDAAGRWQYRYHPASEKRRESRKSRRLVRFAEALPAMRATIERDLASPGLTRSRVLACALRVLSCCLLRPGSRVYARENGSYGLATLRRKHVRVCRDLVSFDFPGKSGKRQTRQMRDRRVARIVRELARAPGEVFKYRDENGAWVNLRRRNINAYIKSSMGEAFSAKDFRTWAGTLLCACALARIESEPSRGKDDSGRKIVRAVRETAEKLGNTPAVCRSSYISPPVLRSFRKGRTIEPPSNAPERLLARRSPGLARPEKAVLRLLRNGNP
jgi:DNA topoisomerase-1